MPRRRNNKAAAPKNAQAPRTKKKTRQAKKKTPDTADQAALYARSVLTDKFHMGLHLPTPDYTGPYHRLHLRSLATPMVAGLVPSSSSVILNPYLLFLDQLHIQKIAAGAVVDNVAPTALRTAVATPTDNPFTQAQQNVIPFLGGQIVTASNQAYTGRARCLGVRFRITYTGTELNKGGRIICYHNPNNRSLAEYVPSNVAGANCITAPFAQGSQYSLMGDAISVHRIGDSFEFVWRPQSLSFYDVMSELDIADVGGAAAATFDMDNAQVNTEGYLGAAGTPFCVVNRGWVTGFTIIPANPVAAGGTLPYQVDIEAEYDLMISRTENLGPNTLSGTPFYAGDHVATRDPVREAHIANALAVTHHARSTAMIPVNATSLSLNSLATTARAYGGKAMRSFATGAIEGLASRMLGALA